MLDVPRRIFKEETTQLQLKKENNKALEKLSNLL